MKQQIKITKNNESIDVNDLLVNVGENISEKEYFEKVSGKINVTISNKRTMTEEDVIGHAVIKLKIKGEDKTIISPIFHRQFERNKYTRIESKSVYRYSYVLDFDYTRVVKRITTTVLSNLFFYGMTTYTMGMTFKEAVEKELIQYPTDVFDELLKVYIVDNFKESTKKDYVLFYKNQNNDELSISAQATKFFPYAVSYYSSYYSKQIEDYAKKVIKNWSEELMINFDIESFEILMVPPKIFKTSNSYKLEPYHIKYEPHLIKPTSDMIESNNYFNLVLDMFNTNLSQQEDVTMLNTLTKSVESMNKNIEKYNLENPIDKLNIIYYMEGVTYRDVTISNITLNNNKTYRNKGVENTFLYSILRSKDPSSFIKIPIKENILSIFLNKDFMEHYTFTKTNHTSYSSTQAKLVIEYKQDLNKKEIKKLGEFYLSQEEWSDTKDSIFNIVEQYGTEETLLLLKLTLE